MSKNYFLVFCFIFIITVANAQSFFKIEGKVYSKDGDVAATHVENITAQKATITDINGFFAIRAKLNDTLVFSCSVQEKANCDYC